jgi:hypothetical protein
VWLLLALTNTEERMELAVDRDGLVSARSLQDNREVGSFDGRGWLPRYAAEAHVAKAEADAAEAARRQEVTAWTRRDWITVGSFIGGAVVLMLMIPAAFVYYDRQEGARQRVADEARRAARDTTTRLELMRHAETPGPPGRRRIRGEVRNVWDAPISDVIVVVTWKDVAGNVLGTDQGRLDQYVVEPDRVVGFRVETKRPPAAEVYSVAFTERDGSAIRTQQRP